MFFCCDVFSLVSFIHFTEAEYAFQQRKKIVPLMLQRGYRPDGWLGFILGAKLFFDFSGKYPFQDKLSDLLKELGRIKGQTQIVPTETVVPKKAEPVSFCFLKQSGALHNKGNRHSGF